MMKTVASRLEDGAIAGLVATLVMSVVLVITRKAGLLGEPPPRLLTRRIASALGLHLKRRGMALNALSLAGHTAYGMTMGALFAMVSRRQATIARGAAFGTAVWALSYMGWVPKLGLMAPPKADRPGRPTSMLAAHLAYGATLALATRRQETPRGS